MTGFRAATTRRPPRRTHRSLRAVRIACSAAEVLAELIAELIAEPIAELIAELIVLTLTWPREAVASAHVRGCANSSTFPRQGIFLHDGTISCVQAHVQASSRTIRLRRQGLDACGLPQGFDR